VYITLLAPLPQPVGGILGPSYPAAAISSAGSVQAAAAGAGEALLTAAVSGGLLEAEASTGAFQRINNPGP
jgi:hypothetical protein